MDALSIVVDEVALEGLDGITVPSLWIRLEDRQPKFPLKLDDPTKELLWNSLISNADFNFYELPHERADVVLYDRWVSVTNSNLTSQVVSNLDTHFLCSSDHSLPNVMDGC